MATTRTQAELARAVMEDLGLIAANEDPAAADQSMILRRYTNLIEEWRDDNIVYWEANAIPYEVFEAVVGAMRLVVGPSFGVPGLVGEDLDNALEGAKRRIRRRVKKPASGQPIAADYF